MHTKLDLYRHASRPKRARWRLSPKLRGLRVSLCSLASLPLRSLFVCLTESRQHPFIPHDSRLDPRLSHLVSRGCIYRYFLRPLPFTRQSLTERDRVPVFRSPSHSPLPLPDHGRQSVRTIDASHAGESGSTAAAVRRCSAAPAAERRSRCTSTRRCTARRGRTSR